MGGDREEVTAILKTRVSKRPNAGGMGWGTERRNSTTSQHKDALENDLS